MSREELNRLIEYAENVLHSVKKVGEGTYENDIKEQKFWLQEPYELAQFALMVCSKELKRLDKEEESWDA